MKASNVPIVAAVYDSEVMSSGLELALSCHYRVATEASSFHFPDAKFGHMPYSSATKLLPRLIGVEPALEMLLDGKLITAEDAVRMNLIDKIIDDYRGVDDDRQFEDFVNKAERFALSKKVQSSNLKEKSAVTRMPFFASSGSSSSSYFSKRKELYQDGISNVELSIIKAVEASTTLSLSDGLVNEILLSQKLVGSKETKAFQYLYFAEKRYDINQRQEEFVVGDQVHYQWRSKNEQEDVSFSEEMLKVGNKMIEACAIECFIMLEEGADIRDIQAVLRDDIGFNKDTMNFWKMFELLDGELVGTRNDRKNLLDSLKIARESQGIEAKNFERQEIFERALYPLVNVGFKALEKSTDMVALDEDNNRDDEYYKDDEDFDIDCFPNPDEVDLMFVKKFGFPAKLGGPLFWAEKDKSLQELLLGILKYNEIYKDNRRWIPSVLLKEVVRSGASIQEELFFQRSKSKKSLQI